MKKIFKKAGCGACSFAVAMLIFISSFTAVALTIDSNEDLQVTGSSVTTGTVSASDDEASVGEETQKNYYLRGRFGFKWSSTTTDYPFEYVGNGLYKYETQNPRSYYAGTIKETYGEREMYFFIADDETWHYTDVSQAGWSFEDKKGRENAFTLNNKTPTPYLGVDTPYMMIFSDSDTNNDQENVTLWLDASDENNLKIWYTDSQPVADYVVLSSKPASTVAYGKNVTLKATLNNVNSNLTGEEFTYIFKDSDGKTLKTITTTKTECSCTVSSTKAIGEDEEYTVEVKVANDITYEYNNKPLNYSSVISNTVNINVVESKLYIREVNPETEEFVGEFIELDNNQYELQLQENSTYSFALFNEEQAVIENNLDYPIDSDKGKYCTISESSLENGMVFYSVTCNENASNPILYISAEGIYAEAVLNLNTELTIKENDNDKMVTYYFAEAELEDTTSRSNPKGTYDNIDASKNEGLRIKYWNNSAYQVADDSDSGIYEGYTDVVNKVEVNGSNEIYVKISDFATHNSYRNFDRLTGVQTFYVYSVDLPIWATSFAFVKSDDTVLETYNTEKYDYGTEYIASKALNPNRINLFFACYDTTAGLWLTQYSRAVVLDESLWDTSRKDSATDNQVKTKDFSVNVVNYNNSDKSTLNTEFLRVYGDNYLHPLLVGATGSSYGSSYYKQWENHALDWDTNRAYFASVQNLTYPTLSTVKQNAMGNGYLCGYDGNVLPLFDYELLKNNSTLATDVYEDISFPFYESTYNGITSYSYDSLTDRNREIVDGKFTVADYAKVGTSNGYAPFGSDNPYGTATEFDIDFYMTGTGYLKDNDGNNQDIAFNFAGDDDVWVYIDGVLVLDLGGAHGVSSGVINFSEMKVYYKSAADTTENIEARGLGIKDTVATDMNYIKTYSLADIFSANGVEFSKTDSSTKHTLQMFYMERGEGESNCSINFNLPQNTGLRINNNISVNSVNSGLKSDTLESANNDYFTYSIADKKATDEEYSYAKKLGAKEFTVYGNMETVEPEYPVKTSNNILRKIAKNGIEYFLAVPNTESSLWSTDYWNDSNLATSEFYKLRDINYSLSDSYALVDTKENAEDLSTDVIGRINEEGRFNLLFSQSANLENKIPNNTLVQIAQADELYTVNAGKKDTTAMSAGNVSSRKVSSYYKTSYVILDNDSNKVLGQSTATTVNKAGEAIYADDKTEIENAFYFSNYADDGDSSANATTVTFTNEVATGKIKITKDVQVESEKMTDDGNSNFYFTLAFSNLFGVSSSSKTYSTLEYTVYNEKTGEKVASRTYGKAGIYFTANQYAVVEGIPVGTSYTLEEKTKAGYKFAKAESTLTGNDGTVISTTSSTKKAVSFSVPTLSESSYNTTNLVAYTNNKLSFSITFKYYDRKVVSGTASHINETASTVEVPMEISTYQQVDTEGKQTIQLSEMIDDASQSLKSLIDFGNVIDEYSIYYSQADAVNAVKNLNDIAGGKKYGEEYSDDVLSKHFDCYGRVQGSENCKTSDEENWITYYNDDEVLTEDQVQETQKITSITVWLCNTLKTYNPTFNVAQSMGELSQKGDVWVANGINSHTVSTYYNMRLGGVNNNATIDASSAYLEEYGIKNGYIGWNPETAETIGNLQFLYWASDKAGTNPISTDINYGYRITNNFKAYAVYGESELTKKGLTLTANDPDYFTDNGNDKIRLNNMMNTYNCPDKDSNITDVSIIYVVDYTEDKKVNQLIEKGGIDALREKLAEIIKKYENKTSFSEGMTFEIEGISFNNDAEITGLVYDVVPYGDSVTSGTNQVALNNKNRLQFTTTFWLDDIYSTNMYAFGAMNYSGEGWIISDNCIHYEFDENSKLTSVDDPTAVKDETDKSEN